MSDQNTIFISYRRSTSQHLALFLREKLKERGYDVFLDNESIGSGDFERIILEEIQSRTHFVALLTHGTLDRCVEPDDWVRREIEHALACERNIVPVLVDGFTFQLASDFLTDRLLQLQRYNAMPFYSEYHEAAIEKLCNDFLVKKYPNGTESDSDTMQEAVSSPRTADMPTQVDLDAERLFVKALAAESDGFLERAIEYYGEAIALKSDYVKAYYNRAVTFQALGQSEAAIADHTTAIELDPTYVKPYINRATLHFNRQEHQIALQDLNHALELEPENPQIYYNRAYVHKALGQYSSAVHDLEQFLRYQEVDENSAEAEEEVNQLRRLMDLLEQAPRELSGLGSTRPMDWDATLFDIAVRKIKVGVATSQGQIRTNNQDAVFTLLSRLPDESDYVDLGLFIVADGMGGHRDGEKASRSAIQIIVRDILNTLYRNVLFNVTAQEPIFEHLVRALENANRIVIQDVPEGGTTCTAALILNDQLFLAHVGDTRAYVLDQSGDLQQLTRDHSLVQRLIELGQLTAEEAENHEHRNVLYRALGQNDEIEVDHIRTKFSPGTTILLCSDGLWGMIEEERIAQIIQEAENPQAACDTLIELANQNGGTDNISAIVVSFAG